MFEKEAEEWVIDNVCKDCSRYEKCKSKEHCTCKECAKEKWQYGAEFGYNKAKVEVEERYRESLCNSELNLASVTEQLEELEKANKWHYPSKGEYPEDYKDILICFLTESGMKDCVRGWCEYYSKENIHIFKYVDILGTQYPKTVIAWKEIVHPEIQEG